MRNDMQSIAEKMSETSSGWKCFSCKMGVPGVPPGGFPSCPFCKKDQPAVPVQEVGGSQEDSGKESRVPKQEEHSGEAVVSESSQPGYCSQRSKDSGSEEHFYDATEDLNGGNGNTESQPLKGVGGSTNTSTGGEPGSSSTSGPGRAGPDARHGEGGDGSNAGRAGPDARQGEGGDGSNTGRAGPDARQGGGGDGYNTGRAGPDARQGEGGDGYHTGRAGPDARQGGGGDGSNTGRAGPDARQGGGGDGSNAGRAGPDARQGEGGDGSNTGRAGPDARQGGGSDGSNAGRAGPDARQGGGGDGSNTGRAGPDARQGEGGDGSNTGRAGPDARQGGGGDGYHTGRAGPDARQGGGGDGYNTGRAGPDARQGGGGDGYNTGRAGPDARQGGGGDGSNTGRAGPDARQGEGGDGSNTGRAGPDARQGGGGDGSNTGRAGPDARQGGGGDGYNTGRAGPDARQGGGGDGYHTGRAGPDARQGEGGDGSNAGRAGPDARQGEGGDLPNETTNNENSSSKTDLQVVRKPLPGDRDVVKTKPEYSTRWLSGLSASERLSISVTFHVLLHRPSWKWNKQSSICIRFGHADLGGWKHDCGPMKFVREVDEQLLEFQLSVSFGKYLFYQYDPLPYKYTVFSPVAEKKDEVYELLHDYDGQTNRSLIVLRKDLELYSKKGPFVCHKFDTVVFPAKNKSSSTGIFQRFAGWVSGSDTKDPNQQAALKPLAAVELADSCFNVYFSGYEAIITTCNFHRDTNIVCLAQIIAQLYSCLVYQKFLSHSSTVRDCFNRDIPQVMKSLLESLVDKLSAQVQSGSVISAALIALVTLYLPIQQPKLNDFVVPLLTLLRQDQEFDKSFLMKDYVRGELARAMEGLYNHLGNNGNWRAKSFDFLKALPLYHYLKQEDVKEKEPGKIFWPWTKSEAGLLLLKLRDRMGPGFVEACFADFERLFVQDRLFLRTCIFLCNDEDIPALTEVAPPYLVIGCLSQRVSLTVPADAKIKQFTDWIKLVYGRLQCSTAEGTVWCLRASFLLFRSATGLRSKLSPHMEMMKAALSLCFMALSKIEPNKLKIVQKFYDAIEVTLKEWIADRSVIGGSVFGGSVAYFKWNPDEERQLWQSIFEVECVEGPIKDSWNSIAKNLLRTRVFDGAISKDKKLGLASKLDASTHSIIVDVFMEAATDAVSLMLEKPSAQSFDRLTAHSSKYVGNLCSTLLRRKYPEVALADFSVSFAKLLDWNLWPNFIKIYGSDPVMKAGLDKECQIACACAASEFQNVCTSLAQQTITMKELRLINKHLDQIKRLCEAAAFGSDPVVSFDVVQKGLQERLDEYKHFEQHRAYLGNLCVQLTTAPLPLQLRQAVDALNQQLRADFSAVEIGKLCVRENKTVIRISFFKTDESTFKFIEPFAVMTQKYSSDIFTTIWRAELTSACACKDNPLTAIGDIHARVWVPSFEACRKLLADLDDQTVSMSDVDEWFLECQGTLQVQLMNLHSGVHACLGTAHNGDWIKDRVKCINQYWQFCKCNEAANAFLHLRDVFGLEGGDFTAIERLASEVTTSMQDLMLKDIDGRLIDASKFLEHIASDKRKLACLQKFSECQEFVSWVREQTKDVNELQKFVNVALATAAGGEDNLAHDKLSNLGVVGSGFQSLIYRLPKDAGYRELSEQCETVWEALDNNPNLPTLLSDCNKQLGWYIAAKGTQGSVEVTSIGQMRNILDCGYFHVGLNRPLPVQSINDIIYVRLIDKEKQFPQTSYSLDDLRDLESKLVLIGGTKSEHRVDVDNFLNILQCVCRVAEVLVALRQAGNTKYINWSYTFHCHILRIDELTQLAKLMEEELAEWRVEVEAAREQYYELNYYTTQQLLILRNKLGELRDPLKISSSVSPSVLALLHSISNDISASMVKHVVLSLLQLTQAASASKPAEEVAEKPVQRPKSTLEQEILASADAQFSEAPKDVGVTLSVGGLSAEEHTMYIKLHETYDYPCKLCLAAIEKIGTNEEQLMDFCEENSENPDYEEGDSDGERESDGSEGDIDDISDEDLPEPSDGKETPEKAVLEDISKVLETRHQMVDESSSDVKDLLDAGFNVKQSIEALELHGDVGKAMEYLESLEVDPERFEMDEDVPLILYSVRECLRRESLAKVMQADSENQSIRTLSSDRDLASCLTMEELGVMLMNFSAKLPAAVLHVRPFPKDLLKEGSPNLIVTHPEHVLKSVLALFMTKEEPSPYDPEHLPLPTYEEVLVCNSETTPEEVIILFRRAFGDYDFKRIFCLMHAERLSYQACDRSLRFLLEHFEGKKEYRLVIICSNEDEDKSHIVSRLERYRKSFSILPSAADYKHYLETHFKYCPDTYSGVVASQVDCEGSSVRVVSSNRSGMGKSLYVQRMGEKLRAISQSANIALTFPIHGPVVTSETVIDSLQDWAEIDSSGTLIHCDIAPNMLAEVDTLLFSLLVLRGLTDCQGRVWRCHHSQLYVVEVTCSDRNASVSKSTVALLELLPTVACVSPFESTDSEVKDSLSIGMDTEEFGSQAYQRVYRSLTSTPKADHVACLKTLLQFCGVRDPSWSEIRNFVSFLNVQLESSELSPFLQKDVLADSLQGFDKFVVKFMIRMSRDFATSSLKGEEQEDDSAPMTSTELQLQKYDIIERKKWEQSSHPYLFFNQDGVTFTFMGFRVTPAGDLVNPDTKDVIEPAIMTKDLFTQLSQNRVKFDENYRDWKKDVMIEKLSLVMGFHYVKDPDDSYVLTVDNLVKMLAIQMRFRCGIPVIIMGETGCGKTRLIRYMCDLPKFSKGVETKNFLIMKVHGGITDSDIVKFIRKAEKCSEKNKELGLDTIVFFDEANTCDAIGLIKEIMCDRRSNGKHISEDIKLIAACNPYRMHERDMISKLETAGLGFYGDVSSKQKLGSIPLHHLVYRVLDLPPSMRPLVYDFGQLKDTTEESYTHQIVSNHVSKHPILRSSGAPLTVALAKVLAWSQWYMRKRKDECSFVSLRDVERAMIVFEYFFEKMDVFGPLMDEKAEILAKENGTAEDIGAAEEGGDTAIQEVPAVNEKPKINAATRALILALGICYHARMYDRSDYEENVTQKFQEPLVLDGGVEQFRHQILLCQEVLLDSMEVGPNIARNAALRENVFMMAICINLRIPLFVVGKPGSSKSLAKTIVSDSMHGDGANSKLLKEFKQVHMFSYQCSQISAPESVIEVFKTAKHFQKGRDTKKFVSVVVLDEVGLAEASPKLPLKALHPLLEDGTEGADDVQEIIQRDERVAFVGISNWALDPAKMNRGVMVIRGEPDANELERSARGICSNDKLEPYLKPLSQAYATVCDKQKKEFFGLRDFYSLIKMLHWLSKQTGMPLTASQLNHAIRRNFGGLQTGYDLGGDTYLDPIEEFEKLLQLTDHVTDLDLGNFPEDIHRYLIPDCSELGMIETSIITKETSWHGENRYLLFLTENYAALDILRRFLREAVGFSGDNNEAQREADTNEPFVLFGSSFPRDKDYTQLCRNINRIKICMETGRTVILLNLENLYESLYDVLNQYYIYYGGSRYVDLGLQTHRVKCRVHDDFKLILIAEKKTVYDRFPTALINRLEKHFVLTSSVLTEWQLDVMKEFEEWLHQFSCVKTQGNSFTETDCFVGFQKDTPAAIVLQASDKLKSFVFTAGQGGRVQNNLFVSTAISPETLKDESEGSDHWKDAVLELCKYLVLNLAAPESLIRVEQTPLKEEKEKLQNLYLNEQHHRSVTDFLSYHLQTEGAHEELLIQVTTLSHLLSVVEATETASQLGFDRHHFLTVLLQEFDTELDFIGGISPAFKEAQDVGGDFLLIVQCDSGHLDCDLIAYARYRVYDERAKSRKQRRTHVVFVIHLPRNISTSKFVGFQGEPWISAHVDDVRSSDESSLTLSQAMGKSISSLFYVKPPRAEKEGESDVLNELQKAEDGEPSEAEESPSSRLYSQCKRLRGCVQAAAARVQDSEGNKDRCTKRVAILLECIPTEVDLNKPLDEDTFYGILVMYIHEALKEFDEYDDKWILDEALNSNKLYTGGTFQNVLVRKIDDIVIPIFTEIIGTIDRNFNLDLIYHQDKTSPLSRFWLAMFNYISTHSNETQHLHLLHQKPRERVPGVGGRTGAVDYKCRLPFSWVIRESVNAHWDNVKSTAGGEKQQLYSSLIDFISGTAIGEILTSFADYGEEFFDQYLYDYVRSEHKSNYKDGSNANAEYELLQKALYSLVNGKDFTEHPDSGSLLCRVAALHVVHHFSKSAMFWFGQLLSCNPIILSAIPEVVTHDDSEMVLHFCALQVTLNCLKLPREKDEDGHFNWLSSIRLTQNVVESVLGCDSSRYLAMITECRIKWQIIRAEQLYMEHIAMKYKGLIKYTRRLDIRLNRGSPANFLEADALSRVEQTLVLQEKGLKGMKLEKPELARIKRSSDKFFTEVVSSLCFGWREAPEMDLIEMLMKMIFDEGKKSTHQLSLQAKADSVPVIRSFLLQLLLEHNKEQFKEVLEVYLQKAQQLLASSDQELCLLCVKCFEDALFKEFGSAGMQKEIEAAVPMLLESQEVLSKQPSMSFSPLECFAKVRFALSVVAETLKGQMELKNPNDIVEEFSSATYLFEAAKNICTSSDLNHIDASDSFGPNIYLLKLLIRRYGFTTLPKFVELHDWLIPKEFQAELTNVKLPYVVYDPQYVPLRRCLIDAIFHDGMEQLLETVKELLPTESVPFFLALHEVISLSGNPELNTAAKAEILGRLTQLIADAKVFSKELKCAARLLITREYCGALVQMQVSPQQPLQQKALSALVVHAAGVVISRSSFDVLFPFVSILSNPAALKEAYWPTMPEDILLQLQDALVEQEKHYKTGRLCKCPNGHMYFIGDCGGAVSEGSCNECGARIGGLGYNLNKTNTQVLDTQQVAQNTLGHTLGEPEGRIGPPTALRQLSSVASCAISALLHSVLVWSCCNNENAIGALVDMVAVDIPAKSLPEFFWKHLEKDLELLQQATGKSFDECLLFCHLILQRVLQTDPPKCEADVHKLKGRTARSNWEAMFKDAYIQPLMKDIHTTLAEGMDHLLYDMLAKSGLLLVVYEKQELKDESNILPHLWSYRSRISLQHLQLTLDQQNMAKKCPLLHMFLAEEVKLRATQYLPDIVRLQRFLYDTFNRRYDKSAAATMTIKGFLELLKNESSRSEYQSMLQSLRAAWSLVKNELRLHARLRVEEAYLGHNFSDDTTLDFLLPTSEGAGACTSALVDFLVLQHNNFIERCRAVMKEREMSTQLSEKLWKKHNVLIAYVHRCHLLDFESQLMSIVLSHCHYSLVMGKAHEVSFDFPALEKHILNRFVIGKPLIILSIPCVTYRKDVYTADTFAAIRKKVAPQTKLPVQVKHEIVSELRTIERIRENLDVVEIVLGFLSSGGSQADKELGKYLDRALKMKNRPFCKAAREQCTVGHILSLWEALSVELSKQLTLSSQKPFEALRPEFQQRFEDTEDDENTAFLAQVLNSFNLDDFLGLLLEFIETFVRHKAPDDFAHNWPLGNTMYEFLQSKGQPSDERLNEFPDTLTLAYVVATWDFVVQFQRDKKNATNVVAT